MVVRSPSNMPKLIDTPRKWIGLLKYFHTHFFQGNSYPHTQDQCLPVYHHLFPSIFPHLPDRSFSVTFLCGFSPHSGWWSMKAVLFCLFNNSINITGIVFVPVARFKSVTMPHFPIPNSFYLFSVLIWPCNIKFPGLWILALWNDFEPMVSTTPHKPRALVYMLHWTDTDYIWLLFSSGPFWIDSGSPGSHAS